MSDKTVERQQPMIRSRGRSWRLSGGRTEPWRDWALLLLINHALLVTVAVLHPAWPWLLATALPLGVGLATATLTVLHDAGHRRFARRTWPNVLAVQTAVPAGLWVGHWTLKHRVHHRVTLVYPLDEATRSSGLVRLHTAAPRRRVHRFQHVYAWALYGLAWLGELRSQLTYVRTGTLAGIDTPRAAWRIGSFVLEKALCLLILLPYAWLLGIGDLSILLLTSMTVASGIAAVATVVGHVNLGLASSSTVPRGPQWSAHLVRTTASFSPNSLTARWLTGGLTHHLAHHLRPVAPRGELPALHRTTVADLAAEVGLPVVEYPTVASAVRGHWQRLRDLGQPEPIRPVVLPAGPMPGREPELVSMGSTPNTSSRLPNP